jgi:hypothetical protein
VQHIAVIAAFIIAALVAAEPKPGVEDQRQNPMVSDFIECSDHGSANRNKLTAVIHDANGSVVHPKPVDCLRGKSGVSAKFSKLSESKVQTPIS